jgi:hypothetical protein
MSLRNILAFALLTASSTVLADTVDINMRDNSVQLQYGASIGRDSLGTSQFHVGYLYTRGNDNFADAGLLVKETAGSSESGLTSGVGLKVILASIGGNDAAALALGGLVHFSPVATPRLGIVGQVYFSPNIVTYRSAERFVEAVARLEFEIIPQAAAYLGYRRISFSLANAANSAVLDSGLHAGVRISF